MRSSQQSQQYNFIKKIEKVMPKAVDIYVLEKKIGCGQFGDVYRGYSKVDGTDVAIKTINRSKIKGKFTELLENEIKVLKSCRNNNIIQLIDIKKTVNNMYLILQYCNEGDLGAYLKKRKKLPEDEAVEYFVQILHAFRTLVGSKIMHRDFKLPNVLKHDGVIKIADFGFSKLLGSEDQQVETILGSPLNMAPQVLDRQAYNTKADIWSIGVSFYEMIFGKVPYTAPNILDLLKKINNQPLVFPFRICPIIEDVIRRMLVVNPKKRIEWNQLFEHPINSYLEHKIEESLTQSIVCQKQELKFNLSKFYIKTNMVVESPYQIEAKEELNNHVKEMMKNQSPVKFQGKLIRRQQQRKKKALEQTKGTQKEIRQEEEEFTQFDLTGQKNIKIMNRNWKVALHQRNIYAFLVHLTQQLLELNYNIYAQCLAFLILKKALFRIQMLKKDLQLYKLNEIEHWQYFQKSEEYKKIMTLINHEEEIFNEFYSKLALKVLEKGTLSQFEEDLMLSGKFSAEETSRRMHTRVMKEYFRRVQKGIKTFADNYYGHFKKLIDSLNLDIKFGYGFDFPSYYEEYKNYLHPQSRQRCINDYQIFMSKQ